jgi:hypothetical protein
VTQHSIQFYAGIFVAFLAVLGVVMMLLLERIKDD